jgi:lipopolysaccharide/colanic/teichoic acid biosynthesis glycosyltransferase
MRAVEKAIAGVCLLACVPLMLIIALSIKLESRGPVFVKQRQRDPDDRFFYALKFRTMRVGQADPRITRVGWVLRELALDEFPQLVNVLRGEMSLIEVLRK